MKHLAIPLLALAMPALAAPAAIAPVIHADKPYGQGAYGFLVLTAYDAQLWTDAAQWSMDTPFALTLHYHMGFTTREFVDRGISEMRHVDPGLDDATARRFAADMTRVFPPVKSGDTITALYRPGEPVAIFHNGAPTGTIGDKDFAKPFFGIWLSPSTSAPSLRAKLLRLK